MTDLLPLLATVLPLLIVSMIIGLRSPLVMLALYAAIIPFGSGFIVPLPLPRPFNTLSTLVGLVATGAIVTHLAVAKRRTPVLVEAMPVWVLFLGLTTLSAAWSVNQSETIGNVAVLFSLVGLYVVTCLVRVEVPDVRRVEAGLAVGAAITGCVALYQWITGTLTLNAGGTPRFQTAGGAGESSDPNITAAALLLPLAICLGRGLHAERGIVRLAYFGVAGLTMAAIALTASRGGILATGVLVLVLAGNSPRGRQLAVYGVTALLAVVLVIALAPDRVTRDGSTGRAEIWRIGLHACVEHCWSGSGWGTFPDVHETRLLTMPDAEGRALRFKAHNIWIRTAVEAGIIGLLLMTTAFALIFRDLFRLPRAVRGPPLAAMAALLVSNLFLSNLEFKYFWMTLLYAALVTVAWHATTRPTGDGVTTAVPQTYRAEGVHRELPA